MNPFTTCAACWRPISENAGDICLHHTSKPQPMFFFNAKEECELVARMMRDVRGKNEWALSYRAHSWDPLESEGMVR